MIEIAKDNYVGCLLGGAIGDALGAPIEFMSLEEIRNRYGKQGIVDFVEYPNHTGEITDDTQMTLFTAEGLLRAYVRENEKGIGGALNTIAHHSYLRWLHTQGAAVNRGNIKSGVYDIKKGWLINQKELYKRRAPGITCINALSSGIAGTMEDPINDSKGCGTIMRMAPVGLMITNRVSAFKVGCELAAITHGHPSGFLSAGFLASITADLVNGISLSAAIVNASVILKKWNEHRETLAAVEQALNLFEITKAMKEEVDSGIVEKLGGGWIAEEALSISLFCSLLFENDFKQGVLFAVNHSGDSDSTGSITGNILGLLHGVSGLPPQWIDRLKYHELVIQVAEDLYNIRHGDYEESAGKWWDKYPGF